MVDITHKSSTLRTAIAQAIVKVSKPETILAIQNDTVPKGNVFAMSKAAGLLGVKRTPDILPDCHPLPIEFTSVDYEINGSEISVIFTVMTIHKSKGLEYHTVIFIGLEDGAFWSYDKQPDEDKCAFFVALSRAMERVVITISKNRKNKWGQGKPQSIKKIQEVITELQNSKLMEIKAIGSAKKEKSS